VALCDRIVNNKKALLSKAFSVKRKQEGAKHLLVFKVRLSILTRWFREFVEAPQHQQFHAQSNHGQSYREHGGYRLGVA
jgi:hypothetical protein